MIIKIDDSYRIRVESYSNNVLEKRLRDKSGEFKLDKDNLPVWKVMGYYPSVKWALRAYSKLDVMDRVSETTVQGYLAELKSEESWIEKLFGVVE
ncbi:hypothetical protein [Levilactobacillus enshiensis]|uniref:hypothetical protein n=1 Tax=Levilactobacillus enshiensis TaxID=2590213 RepID=UPI00117A5180|nr:hypothetical protein [Levilactobacillus enshiensis]